MASGGPGASRAFVQKLPKGHAHDIRNQTAQELKGEHGTSVEKAAAIGQLIGRSSVTSISSIQAISGSSVPLNQGSYLHPGSVSSFSSSSTVTFGDVSAVEPLDYEEYVQQQRRARPGFGMGPPGPGGLSNTDPAQTLIDFPSDDIEVSIVPRKIRTMGHVVPEEKLDTLDPIVQNCVECYKSDWVVVKRRYQQYSSSVRTREELELGQDETLPRQEFELDDTPETSPEADHAERTPTNERSQSPIGTPIGELSSSEESLSKSHEQSLARLLEEMSLPMVMKEKKDKFVNGNDQGTRGSWASFDLKNSQPDAPIAGLFDSIDADTVDSVNELKRSEKRPKKIFALFHHQPESEMTERRFPAKVPQENVRHRILVQCNKLQLPLEIEPMFASMALYDAKEKKKISENFYFDMNTDKIKAMLSGQPDTSPIELSTLARSCVFNISAPSNDLFIVVKLEKVLQGDLNDAAEPYLKEMQNMDKPKANAFDACNRLGRYRMPFAWTAIWLHNIIKGKDSLQERDSGSDAESTASNSLDRKSSTSSFEQFRRNAKVSSSGAPGDSSSLTRKGSLDRKDKRSSWTSSSGLTTIESSSSVVDIGNLLDTFPPVTLTVSSFFKQEPDKLRDEDLYKFLQELKRSSPIQKRLKCIRATLKLDISVAPEQTKYCFTPELAKFIPFPDMKTRPTKEILEFSPRETFVPNYQFRNLLYVSPKDVNFANRSGERARNIAVKIQFMEEDGMKGMKSIFGKSSCPEFTNEVYSAVTYHNKSPDFYEEVKIKLPSNLRDYHHILFSFYHISCQGQRREQHTLETPVGYTWIPVFRDGSLQTGLFELPVMLDPPSAEIRRLPTEAAPSGTKWIDNKKPIFTVEIQAASTVHPLDSSLDRFFLTTAPLQLGNLSSQHHAKIEKITEDSLIKKIREISNARLEPLVRFLPLVLDKLLLLVVKPPNFGSRALDVGQAAFNAIAEIVNKISTAHELKDRNDRHGRNDLLTTYIHWQAHLPHPDFRKGSGCKGSEFAPIAVEEDALRSIGDCDVGTRMGKATSVQLARSLLRRQNGCGARTEAVGEVIVELKSQL